MVDKNQSLMDEKIFTVEDRCQLAEIRYVQSVGRDLFIMIMIVCTYMCCFPGRMSEGNALEFFAESYLEFFIHCASYGTFGMCNGIQLLNHCILCGMALVYTQ